MFWSRLCPIGAGIGLVFSGFSAIGNDFFSDAFDGSFERKDSTFIVSSSFANDLSVDAVLKKTNVLVGSPDSIDIVVSNSGPSSASAVTVTNDLPAGVALGNVAVSQGSWSVIGSRLFLQFGAIGPDRYALANVEFTCSSAGTLVFATTAGRTESENYLENNRVTNQLYVSLPLVSVSPASAAENAGSMVFTVQLDNPSVTEVTVRFETFSGTATAGSDFVPTNGLITFPPNTTNAEVRVALIDDNVFEVLTNQPPEYFLLQLSSATNAAIGTASASGSILENERLPSLLARTIAVPEGDSGTNPVPIVIEMSGITAMPVDVQYETRTGADFDFERGFTFYGTATDGSDFLGAVGSFTFNPGQTQQVIHVSVIGDTTAEPDETFSLRFTSSVLLPAYPTRPRPLASLLQTITIADDDPPSLLVDDYRVVDGNCVTPNSALDPGETVTVLFRVRNVGYNACTSSNLTATLLSSGGILNPSAAQNYGAICGGAPEVWRLFTFTVGSPCASNVVATFSFTDSGTNYGTSSLTIPIGRRGTVLSENFDATPVASLPAGWAGGPYIDSPWYTTNEPPQFTNHFVHVTFQHSPQGAVTLASPPFSVTSSNAWLKLRHRFEITTVNARASVSFRVGGNYAAPAQTWTGSSRGWAVSLLPIPSSLVGATQQIYFELAVFTGPLPATWDIDSVEVIDGPTTCCEAGAPTIAPMRRGNSEIVVQWNSISNRVYQVQVRPSVQSSQPWIDLGPPIVAYGPTMSRTDLISSSNAFYRVILNP